MDKDTVEIIKDIVTMAASIGAFFVALAGLTAWRRQLRGKEHYELARRYLVKIYQFKAALADVRYPAIWAGELNEAIKENEHKEGFDTKDGDKAVYSKRWRKVDVLNTELQVELWEAEAHWGKEAVTIADDLFKCRNRLYLVVLRFIDNRSKDKDDDILYDSFGDDPFNKDLDAAVAKIEIYLRRHLK